MFTFPGHKVIVYTIIKNWESIPMISSLADNILRFLSYMSSFFPTHTYFTYIAFLYSYIFEGYKS